MSVSPWPTCPSDSRKMGCKGVGVFFWNHFLVIEFHVHFLVIEFHVQDRLSLPHVTRWELQVCSDKQAACRQLETSGLAESSH